jgi:hypothetical protein
MNNNQFYERRDDPVIAEPSPPQAANPDLAELAVHPDPSIRGTRVEEGVTAARPGVAWVRPSELPTVVGSGWVRRGIDLQSELMRRSRRGPVTASRAAQRVSRSAIARPRPDAPTPTDGIGL